MPKKASSKPKVKVSVSYANCTIYSTLPMTCFLCGEWVPPKTYHQCSNPESTDV